VNINNVSKRVPKVMRACLLQIAQCVGSDQAAATEHTSSRSPVSMRQMDELYRQVRQIAPQMLEMEQPALKAIMS
jgi:hypothetical protein